LKKIFLIRHAKSNWSNSEFNDFNRLLNNQGKIDAPFMGKRLFSKKVYPDLIITSPAKRALNTTIKIAKEINYPDDKIIQNKDLYLARIPEFVEIINNISNSISSVFIVSHNPGITETAEYLTGEIIDTIPTTGILCIEFNTNSWHSIKKEEGRVLFFDYPKKHKR